MDDVSNFSGGGSRSRDDTIFEVTTNRTFSPSTMAKQQQLLQANATVRCVSTIGAITRLSGQTEIASILSEANNHNETSVSHSLENLPTHGQPASPFKPISSGVVTLTPVMETTLEAVGDSGVSQIEAKRRALQTAAAQQSTEEIEEIADVEWHGPPYVQDLPFIGFSYTPGLIQFWRNNIANVTSAGGTGQIGARSLGLSQLART
ncbi:unnamed protein product [Protopolystoma xenopodis]|uniref:Uncharacterized protein n=1 Tax=Protopolystoma xenopodis TaxID=117903 RepID=A0A3S5B935_9PLAT|nr:unnamed protein product [Protopolystoma xenopodis]